MGVGRFWPGVAKISPPRPPQCVGFFGGSIDFRSSTDILDIGWCLTLKISGIDGLQHTHAAGWCYAQQKAGGHKWQSRHASIAADTASSSRCSRRAARARPMSSMNSAACTPHGADSSWDDRCRSCWHCKTGRWHRHQRPASDRRARPVRSAAGPWPEAPVPRQLALA